ncbi:ABC transporter permease [Bacteroides sp. GM023]|uniref:ABC transporter permease n=1 Tax=Bacteroides sp. GM023 TaxID=2723058 RepID=UPI00168AEDE6|nr:ABC transporter permease [Bacteroides sp. GM023]MBD3588052.1 ABC transporter permease [Bacteroides sp. GM023]
MQLLKQVWNERRSNGWLWAELLIVFVVLWFVVDWTYVTARTYYEPVGFDITDTYYLELSLKNNKSDSYIPKDKKNTTLGQDITELTNRLRRLPEVEAVSVSSNARPYIGSNSGMMLRIDTIVRNPLRRPMTPDFFQVFRYQSADGRGYQPLVQALKNGNVVVSENLWPDDFKGDRTLLGREVVNVDDSTEVFKIGGVSTKVRYNDFWPNYSDRYIAIAFPEKEMSGLNGEFYPSNIEVCLRVKPGTAKDFSEHLMNLSASQLSVGNLFILKVHDYENIRNDFQQGSYNQVQVRFWMMGFLLMNILLGIVGTFWFRTQHRRSELALRVAVGSSRMQLWNRLNSEGLMLLSLAALPAAIICYNIGYLDLMDGYMEWGIVRFLITFAISYFLMALMILAGIWFPARQAIRIQPAEALREE